jgi:hypothetical protein
MPALRMGLEVEEEKATNAFLRAAEPALARAVGMEPGADPAAVFTAAARSFRLRFSGSAASPKRAFDRT